jgi:hypothetical protein
MWLLRIGIVRNVVEPRVRRNGSYDLEGYSLRFTENGHENKHCKNSALQTDRNGQRAAARAPLTRKLFGVAIYQASA